MEYVKEFQKERGIHTCVRCQKKNVCHCPITFLDISNLCLKDNAAHSLLLGNVWEFRMERAGGKVQSIKATGRYAL